MKMTKKDLKAIIMEELQNIHEQQDGFEMEIDMGTLFQGNMVRVTVSQSETSHDKIVINSINGEDAKHFVEAVVQEVPFEIQISKLSRDEQNALAAAMEKEKKGEWSDWAADQAANRR